MKNFNFQKKEVVFWKIKGKVSDSNESRHTIVSTTPGLASTGSAGNSYITATTVNKQYFWVTSSDGKEFKVELTNAGVPIKNGHTLEILCARRKEKDTGEYVAIDNKSMGQVFIINTASSLAEKLNLPFLLRVWLVLAVFIIIMMTVGKDFIKYSNQDTYKIYCAYSLSIFLSIGIYKKIISNIYLSKFKKHIDSIIKQ